MESIRCTKCQHENSRNLDFCEQCGTELLDTDRESLAKANPLMQQKQISDETQSLRDETMPKTDEEWHEVLERHKAEHTIEASAIDSDMILQAELNGANEPMPITEQLPNMEDEESILRIGPVRFKGDLVLKHQESGMDFTIKNNALQEVVIGRLDRVTGFSPSIDLTDVNGKEKGVSRRHATISIRGDLLVVTDHKSMNGTFLNGQRLVPEQARVVRDADVLRIGRVNLLVHFKNY